MATPRTAASKLASSDQIKELTKLLKEYVSGSTLLMPTKGVIQIMMPGTGTPDLATHRQLPASTYEEMLTDPDVAAGYWFLVLSTLADGIMIRPAEVDKEDTAGVEQSKQVADFCSDNLKRIKTRELLE